MCNHAVFAYAYYDWVYENKILGDKRIYLVTAEDFEQIIEENHTDFRIGSEDSTYALLIRAEDDAMTVSRPPSVDREVE